LSSGHDRGESLESPEEPLANVCRWLKCSKGDATSKQSLHSSIARRAQLNKLLTRRTSQHQLQLQASYCRRRPSYLEKSRVASLFTTRNYSSPRTQSRNRRMLSHRYGRICKYRSCLVALSERLIFHPACSEKARNALAEQRTANQALLVSAHHFGYAGIEADLSITRRLPSPLSCKSALTNSRPN